MVIVSEEGYFELTRVKVTATATLGTEVCWNSVNTVGYHVNTIVHYVHTISGQVVCVLEVNTRYQWFVSDYNHVISMKLYAYNGGIYNNSNIYI